MSATPEQETTVSNRRWLGITAAAVLILVASCVAVGVVIWLRSHPKQITPALERTAQAALQNPASASIVLTDHYSNWYPASGRDYAVQSNMVIFPQPPRNAIIEGLYTAPEDKTMPATVYAPGRTLSSSPEPAIPDGRAGAKVGEWFLFQCAPIPAHPDWWDCTLLVGGSG